MKKIILVLSLILFIAAGVAFASISTIQTVSHVSVLSGTVISTVHEEQVVKEGDVLVNVKTKVGDSPASRAQLDGKVVKVLVTSGQQINAGEIVVIVARK